MREHDPDCEWDGPDEEDWGIAEPSTDDILVGTEDDFDLDELD